MNGQQGQSDRSEPISTADEADRICAEFEQAWRSGDRPRMEDWLDRAASAEKCLLLQELLEIELHVRQQQGDLPAVEEYAKRFPEDQQLIAAVFAKHVRRRLGDYEILREIGRGGMGVVYQAQHRLLNQRVALKVLPEPALGDRQAVRRFQREMLSVGSLNHPNIIRALNAGEERDVHYLVMEYVDGWDFRELVAQHGRLAPGAACELIWQAAVGLQYIHEHDMVHRDIKPANLMLARDGTVKILDLGLARLETRHRSRELTQPGSPMGTVDYMAPEQWVDSSAVDIRADIYSLGCTLFFLLVGLPPGAMQAGETPARRRMGKPTTHPPVAALRRDCPPDVDKILERMLAEEPDQRFDTPGDVADALGVLADAQQVAALASASCQDTNAGRGVAAAGPVAKAPTHPHAARQTSYDGFGARLARGVERRPRWSLEVVGGAAILLLALAVWLGIRFHGGPADSLGTPTDANHADSKVMAAEIGSLPGLNGRWWFDEMPWLIPSVRESLTGTLAAGTPSPPEEKDGFRLAHWLWNPNIRAVQDRLVDLVLSARDKLTPAQSALVAELLAVSRQDFGDEQLAARLSDALGRFVRASDASGKWSATDLHTRGVVQHKIVTINNDRSLAEAAAKSYEAALAAYGSQGGMTCSLRARCLVDSGQLYALVFQDYAEARRRFREARALPQVPLLLQVEAWLDEGIASASVNRNTAEKYAEAGYALTQAQQLLQDAKPGGLNHPLLAHVHERYAWILMDQWNVRKANQEFQEARNIRFDNYWKSKNDFAQIFVFHNDHGQAMAERYCGDERMARAQYELVIGEIEKALARADAKSDRPGWQRFRRDLRERWSNSCERRADCELYGGAASGAGVDLQEAARLYAVARDQADDPAVRIAMSCKRSLALALDGQTVEAQQELQQTAVSQQVVIGVQEERVRLLRKLAEATLLLKTSDAAAGLTAVRAFLKEFDLDPNYPDRHRRETQELQLLAAELLIATELQQKAREAAVADLTFLDRLIAAFPYREQMLPYLRRYYDLAIEAVAASDPERAAGYILASRDERPVSEATLLLFHFTSRRGLAILRPGRATAVCYPLAFGREEIRQAAAEGRTLTLPQELVESVLRDRQAGRKVVSFWSDARCWAKADRALSKQDWPFAGQLDLDQPLEHTADSASQDRRGS